MKINNFTLNTEYATLKNDTSGNTISVTIPYGRVFDPNTVDHVIASTTMTVGKINAGVRALGSSSRFAGVKVVGTTMYSLISVNDGYGTFDITIWCYLRRISNTTVQLLVTSEAYGSGSPNFTVMAAQTITFDFSTFLSPFDS